MIAVDTNILIYAEIPDDRGDRHRSAAALLAQAGMIGAIMPLQVIGEFLNVCRKKQILDADLAVRKAADLADIFLAPATQSIDLLAAAGLSSRHNLQYFDALIITVAQRAGATVLLSEDLHDRQVIDRLTIVNPFVAANESVLADCLGSAL